MTTFFKNRFQDKAQKGYTLLFSVIVAVLVLSIATFILSVSRKEFLLSATARDSVYAFYAADAGLECAVYNLNALGTTSFVTTIPCGMNPSNSTMGGVWDVTRLAGSNQTGTSTFYMYVGANDAGGSSCATVSVGQWYDANGNRVTNIESRGNNIGWNPPAPSGNGTGSGNCSTPGPRKVERALRLVYD